MYIEDVILQGGLLLCFVGAELARELRNLIAFVSLMSNEGLLPVITSAAGLAPVLERSVGT